MSQVKIINAPFEELRRASSASGGTALSTTSVLVALPENADWVGCIAHNFVGALVARLSFNPYLTIIKTTDLLATPGVNLSTELQDGDTTAVAMDVFNSFANGGALYIGSWMPFGGARVTVGSDPQNTGAITLTVKYWNGSEWVDISATDGTSGATAFDQTGDVTWTVPTGWAEASLKAIDDVSEVIAAGNDLFQRNFTPKSPYLAPLYWTRWEVSAVTEDTWNLYGIQPLNRSSSLFSEWPEGYGTEMSLSVGPAGFSCIEALVDAGAAHLIVNVASRPDTAGRRMS